MFFFNYFVFIYSPRHERCSFNLENLYVILPISTFLWTIYLSLSVDLLFGSLPLEPHLSMFLIIVPEHTKHTNWTRIIIIIFCVHWLPLGFALVPRWNQKILNHEKLFVVVEAIPCVVSSLSLPLGNTFFSFSLFWIYKNKKKWKTIFVLYIFWKK